jgi:uncharacterized membrane protein
MAWFSPHDRLDRAFAAGIILKALNGVLEFAGGLLLLVVPPATINRLVAAITQTELSEDSRDFVATHLTAAAGHLTLSTAHFDALYLISHALVKIVLAIAVLKGKLWAYPWMIAFLAAFIVYQLYRMTFAPSAGLAALTAFDVIIAGLTFIEYRRHRRHLHGAATPD